MGKKALQDPRYKEAFVNQANPDYVQLYHDRKALNSEFVTEAKKAKADYDKKVQSERLRSAHLDEQIFSKFEDQSRAELLRRFNEDVKPEDKRTPMMQKEKGTDEPEDDSKKSEG